MVADLKVIGPAASFGRYLAAGQTAVEAGEPVHSTSVRTSGVGNSNVYVLAAADTPIVATHQFGGVAVEKAELAAAGTTIAQFLNCACPVPSVGRIRGKAETAGDVDTLAKIVLLLSDSVLIDYAATGGSDGGELYTIKEVASADSSGLEIVGGNPALGTLDVTIDGRAYRTDVA